MERKAYAIFQTTTTNTKQFLTHHLDHNTQVTYEIQRTPLIVFSV